MNPEQPEEQPAEYQLRRATLEDLPELKKLWGLNHLPVDELEKRFAKLSMKVERTQSDLVRHFPGSRTCLKAASLIAITKPSNPLTITRLPKVTFRNR